MYNKLFSKILDSSIWLEPTATRIVWLTFLAVMDEHGFVQFASTANVAHRARVTLEEAEDAVRCLESADGNSSDPDNDGRRVERVPGGWMVLNAKKHRDMVTKAIIQEQTRVRVQRHREKAKASPVTVTPPRRHGSRNAVVTQANEQVTPSVAVSVVKEVSEKRVVDLSKGERGNGDSPPLVTDKGTALAPSPTVQRFVVRFYGNATPARRTDIAGQMYGAILNNGVWFNGSLVKAVDEDHLDAMCLEVMEEPPRDPNASWVFVLKKLAETYLEVLSARAKALELPRGTRVLGLAGDAPAGATPIRAALAGVLDGLGVDVPRGTSEDSP